MLFAHLNAFCAGFRRIEEINAINMSISVLNASVSIETSVFTDQGVEYRISSISSLSLI